MEDYAAPRRRNTLKTADINLNFSVVPELRRDGAGRYTRRL
jgi:hypothetical protein